MDNATVPPGWRTFTLDELFEFSNGVNADKSAYGEGIPFVNVLDVISNEALTGPDIPGRIRLSPSLTARYQVRYGDVLLNRTSETQDEVGLTSVYLGDFSVLFGGFVFRARPRTNHLDVGYSKYALRASYVREQIIACGQGGIRANVGQRDLKKVRVSLPVPEEQRLIAQALRDIDDQVEALERMLAKKQAIKQGIMQHLLTDKSGSERSLASGGDAALGAIATWFSGGTPDRNNPAYWGGTIPWISAATLKQSHVYESDQHLTDSGVRAGSKIAPAGAILVLVRGMALHRETRIGVTTRPVSFNQDVKALIPKPGVIPDYLLYALQARSSQLLDLVSSAGSGTGVLNTQLLQRLPIWVPEETVQVRIVGAIDAADREVGLFRERLAKTHAVKLGMMQQLLTGRTRLPDEERES